MRLSEKELTFDFQYLVNSFQDLGSSRLLHFLKQDLSSKDWLEEQTRLNNNAQAAPLQAQEVLDAMEFDKMEGEIELMDERV